MSRDQLIQVASEWVLTNAIDPPENFQQVGEDTNLISSGLVDSLALVNLITFLENVVGCEIDLLEIEPEELVTLRGLCNCAIKSHSG